MNENLSNNKLHANKAVQKIKEYLGEMVYMLATSIASYILTECIWLLLREDIKNYSIVLMAYNYARIALALTSIVLIITFSARFAVLEMTNNFKKLLKGLGVAPRGRKTQDAE